MVQGGYNAVLTEPDSLDAHLLDTLAGGGWINDQELVLDAGDRGAGARARAGVALRLPVRSHAGGPDSPEAVRRPEPRPHHPQGRPHRHRDHEPPDRAGARARPASTRWRNAARWSCCSTTRVARPARWCSTCARGAFVARARPRHAAGDGRRAHDVPGDRVLGRQVRRRHRARRTARGCRCATWRWCSSIPPASSIPGSLMTGALLEEGLRGAGGHLRNGHGERFMARYDAARMERSTRDLVSRASFLEVTEGPRHAERRRVDRRLAPRAPRWSSATSAAWSGAAATSAATWRAARSRSVPPRTS